MIAVDLFAGGGGASDGIRRALGVEPAVAINHDEHAIRMHALNHPDTAHFHEDVFEVKPRRAVGRRTVDLLWASPDCTHFSRAKGGVPRRKEIRGLAWVVIAWARDVRPRVICMENVPEFTTWGPLDERGLPIRERAGETFRNFIGQLEAHGYVVEWRTLVAADYGAPTSRKRWYLIARCDGVTIRWPEPTHGPGRAQPWRTAAECIDWSIPVPSIFDRPRPLAEKTLRRVAEGVRRYVLEAQRPFLLCLTHGGRLEPLDAPLRTTTTANRGERALVAPMLTKAHSHGWDRGAGPIAPADGPAWTVTAKDGTAVVAPTLIQVGYGEREGQAPRVLDLEEPLGTAVGGGRKHALVAAFLAQHNRGAVGRAPDAPLQTIAGHINKAVVAAHLTKFYGTSIGADLDDPMPTVTGQGWHAGLVAAFLLRYYGSGGQWSSLSEPMRTATAKARMGLVTVELDGESYVLADIGMRMLEPRELARAQGFADDYRLIGTKSQQVERIGNSVCPPVAEAIVRAQLGDELGRPRARRVSPQVGLWGAA